MKIGLVTDSTGYVSREDVEKHNIEVIPLKIIYPDGQIFDESALNWKEYFSFLKTAKKLPTTSQPSAGEFENIYSAMFDKGYEEILSIHISAGLSGTVQSALMARDTFQDKKIEVYDSFYTAMALGFQVVEAANLIKENASIPDILACLDYMRNNTKLLFMVDTLEYLHKGGRIGGAQALLGSILQLKPILTMFKKVETYDKVRTRQKALARLVEEMEKEVQKAKGRFKLGVLHLEAPDTAKYLEEKLKVLSPDISMSVLGPCVGTHVGPGTVGVCITHLP
ncbi:MAG: DegV domain-containing protein [candidate division WS2 bacterium]|nr:DegV domain-containing protein [Candidatus Lithacetigena glycinireducens]